ncbi:ribosome biogenesis GTPase Der [Candidatus Saccharibacteria bacterium]|nr:ribosome biogenesis GTPase Der [Candidatus Saccharibacteria bacterium]
MSRKLPIVAIVGRANVGKSSLFNTILKRREAITAKEAGTTRDSLLEKASYKGYGFWLIDTAGIKNAQDEFEFTIQEQISQAADSADVIWLVIEADISITNEDRILAKKLLKTKKPIFLVVNKQDKNRKATTDDFNKLGIKDIYLTSTTQNQGIEELLDELVKELPKVTFKKRPETIHVSLIGRPNVGKSYLFNKLAKKQQAIVADRAGTTRDINRIDIRYEGKNITLMDTAGIRRSGKIEKGIEHFSVIRSLSAIEQSDVCLLLMDANELNVTLDQKLAGLIKESGKGLILVVSKWDSLEDKTAFTRDQLAAQIKQMYDFAPWAALVFTSSVTGQNVTKLFELVTEIYSSRNKLIKTSVLNRWLKQVIEKHPPAGLKNRSPKLNYITQEEENPTNFKIYGSQVSFLHWSYKRYMERELRREFGFEGTAIKLWFFEKHSSHKHGQSPTKD